MVAIRKNITTLSADDVRRYVSACKTLKSTGEYDTFIQTHWSEMTIVHGRPPNWSPWFLPWHRAFLLDFEERVQRVLADPSFGLPYWDWTKDYDGKENIGAVWGPDHLGGAGLPVSTGPFQPKDWRTGSGANGRSSTLARRPRRPDPDYKTFGPSAVMPPTFGTKGALTVDQVLDVVGARYAYDSYSSIDPMVLRVWTGTALGAGTNDEVTASLTFTVADNPGVVVATWSAKLNAKYCDHQDPFEQGAVDTFTFQPAAFSKITNPAALTPECLASITIALKHESWWTGAWDLLRLRVLAGGASLDSGLINQTLSNTTTTSITVPLLRPVFPPLPA